MPETRLEVVSDEGELLLRFSLEFELPLGVEGLEMLIMLLLVLLFAMLLLLFELAFILFIDGLFLDIGGVFEDAIDVVFVRIDDVEVDEVVEIVAIVVVVVLVVANVVVYKSAGKSLILCVKLCCFILPLVENPRSQ